MAAVSATIVGAVLGSVAAGQTVATPLWIPIGGLSERSFRGWRLIHTPVKLGRIENVRRRIVNIKAVAAEGAAPEVVAEPAVEAPANPISALKLQSDILKKKAKKEELKRKRLVRKRHLRKKGRWPPSKMKKNQNV